MKHVKIFGMTVMALLAVSAVGVSGASAALLLFLASTTGLLLGHLVGGPHQFVTEEGTVECEVANAHGTVSSTATEIQAAIVTYEKCKVSGLGVSATITPAEYLFNANGTATLDNLVKVNAGSGLCIINIEPQGPLSTIGYDNIAGPPMEILVLANVTGISYEASSVLCPKKGKFNGGTYKGTELVNLDGGEILID